MGEESPGRSGEQKRKLAPSCSLLLHSEASTGISNILPQQKGNLSCLTGDRERGKEEKMPPFYKGDHRSRTFLSIEEIRTSQLTMASRKSWESGRMPCSDSKAPDYPPRKIRYLGYWVSTSIVCAGSLAMESPSFI